jgi:tetratricopeptide (TPR) repeat protein
MAELAGVLDTRVFLIVAAAGFGKTTVLQQTLADLDALAVLIPLREAHKHDAALMCSAMLERLRGLRPNFGAHTTVAMRAGLDPKRLAHALAADLALLTERVALALDDVHSLNASPGEGTSAGMTLVSELLGNEGLSDVHWILASRTLPPLRFSRLALEGQSRGLGEAELAFTTDETRSYLERMSRRPVSLAEARAFRDATEGWPAALALSQISPSERGIPKKFPIAGAFDYLEEEVMPALPEELRGFVIGAAALTDLSPELCDYALARTNSFQCLKELEHRNLFIQRLPGKEQVFRFHAIFREFLLERHLDPTKLETTRREAARFWKMKQRWLDALMYLHEAAAWPELLALVDQQGRSLVEQGYTSTVRQALDTLEQQRVTLPASLSLLHAEALIRASNVPEAKVILDGIISDEASVQADMALLRARAARIGGDNEATIRLAEGELRQARCTSHQEAMLHRFAALGHRSMGNFAAAEQHDLQALERFEALGNLAEAAYTRCMLGLNHEYAGVDYLKAERYYRQSLRAIRRLHRPDILAMVLNNLASILIITGRSRDALDLLQEARAVVEETGDLYWLAEVAHSTGEALRSLGDSEGALAAFEESTQVAWECGSKFPEQSSCLWRAIVLSESGRDAEVEPLLGLVRDDLIPKLGPLAVLVDLHRTWLRGNISEAMALAQKLILEGRDTNQERYVRFGRLFLAAALSRDDASHREFMAVLNGLAANASQAQDAFVTWPDVGEAVLASVGKHPDNVQHFRAWRALLDRLGADRVFGPKVLAASRRPKEIRVFTLAPTVVVHVDGRPHAGWRRRGALEALLYLVHHKSGGQEMATALVEDPRVDDPDEWATFERGGVSKRFQNLLVALKRALGQDAIQPVGDSWPRRYALHPDITIVYDVEQFKSMAGAILREAPRPEHLEAIRVAKGMRPEAFAPAQGALRMHRWVLAVHREVELLYQDLLMRERELAAAVGLPTAQIDAEIEVLRESGIRVVSEVA